MYFHMSHFNVAISLHYIDGVQIHRMAYINIWGAFYGVNFVANPFKVYSLSSKTNDITRITHAQTNLEKSNFIFVFLIYQALLA